MAERRLIQLGSTVYYQLYKTQFPFKPVYKRHPNPVFSYITICLICVISIICLHSLMLNVCIVVSSLCVCCV